MCRSVRGHRRQMTDGSRSASRTRSSSRRLPRSASRTRTLPAGRGRGGSGGGGRRDRREPSRCPGPAPEPRSPGSMTSDRARRYLGLALERLGVEVRAGVEIIRLLPDAVELAGGELVHVDACLWTTGFVAPALAAQAGLTVDPQGRRAGSWWMRRCGRCRIRRSTRSETMPPCGRRGAPSTAPARAVYLPLCRRRTASRAGGGARRPSHSVSGVGNAPCTRYATACSRPAR